MDKIDLFLRNEICMDMKSDEKDVIELSKIIKESYSINGLYRYWRSYKDEWDLVFRHKERHIWDAYAQLGAESFKKTHPMFTAAEILGNFDISPDINENEIMNLLRE